MSTEGEFVFDIEPMAAPREKWSARRLWSEIENALERIGDRLNPILVKETRQALKSRQFLITFALLLFLGWGWSILGIANIGPAAFVGNCGADMFTGYFAILSFPLLVIVPFGAFRSLATEQETRTYELLSITALGTRQIVLGKLGSAMLQMSVYLSTISPCLGFTYLLRGIDLLSIFLILFWLTMASLGLSALGLLMATITPKRTFQVIPMIASIIGFFLCFWGSIPLCIELLQKNFARLAYDWEFWAINGAILTAFVGYFLMVCEAAAARLSFGSDNRSSRLRAIMVLHQMLFTGWMIVPWLTEARHEFDFGFFLGFMMLAGIQWYVLGALMIGESSNLSSRVKRQLPQSFLGRVFLTWFYPGPAKGFMLTLTGLLCTFATVGIGYIVREFMGWTVNPMWRISITFWDHIVPFGMLGFCYIVIYLGLGLLLIRLIRRFTVAGLVLSVLLQIFLLLMGCLVPLIIQLTLPEYRNQSYSLLQITNPLWTLAEVLNRNGPSQQLPYLLAFVPMAAVVVFLLNLPGIVREVRNIRIIKPQRVLEEEAALEAAKEKSVEDGPA